MNNAGYKKPFFTFLCYTCASVLLCGLLAAYFGIRYDGVDDAFISDIASGAFGTSDNYFLIIGYPLSAFIGFLRALLPSGINWYSVFSLTIICVALGCTGLCLHRRFGFMRGGLLFAAYALLCASQSMMAVNRVKTASVVIAGGLLLLCAAFTGLKAAAVPASLLCMFGAMYSRTAAVCAAVIFVPVAAAYIIHSAKRARIFISLGICAALCVACFALDNFEYSGSRSAHKSYLALTADISEKNVQLGDISALEFTQTDLELLKTGDYNDDSYFTEAKLTAIDSKASARVPADTFATLASTVQGFGTVPLLVFVGVCAALAAAYSLRRNKPYLLALLVCAAACVLYLAHLGSLDGARLLAVLVPMSLLALMLVRGSFSDRNTILLTAGILGVLCVPLMFEMRAENRAVLAENTSNDAAWAEVFADNETLYVLSSDCLEDMLSSDVFHARPSGAFTNLVFLGGLPARSVLENEILNDYGQKNPWQAVADGAPLLRKGDITAHQNYLTEKSPGKTLTKIGTVPTAMYAAY